MPVGPDLPVVMSLSGKGGVGKSLLSIGLTAAIGVRVPVGLLDVDIRSPNIPVILHLPGRVDTDSSGRSYPIIARLRGRDVPVVSSSFVFGRGTAITMGGAQMVSTIKDLIYDFVWPEISAMVVDVDPGPGDSLKAIRGIFRRVSAIIVSTSDPSSLEDCARMVDACQNAGIEVLGILANMAGTSCPRCSAPLVCAECGGAVAYGEQDPVEDLATHIGARFMGSLPWDPRFRTDPVGMVSVKHRAVFDSMGEQFLEWAAVTGK